MRVRIWICGVRGSTPAPGLEFGRYGGHTSCLAVGNDGEQPSLILDAGTGIRRASDLFGGYPGLFEGRPYTGGLVQLAPNDALFLYTDGVSEATNNALDDFSDERLAASIRAAGSLPCRDILDCITRELLAFTDGAPQSDDITMLSLRLNHRYEPMN